MITAIIPSRRPAWDTFPTLVAVASQSRRPDRIVVIDDTQGGDYPWLRDERVAWFCLREEIRVVNSNNLDIPPGTGGYERLAHIRPGAAKLAGQGWLWFVDDDVIPEHDCLYKLKGCADMTNARCVAAAIDELLPHAPPYWPRDSWGYNHHHRPGSKLVGATGLGCTIVPKDAFLALQHRTVRPDIGLEDVVATAQLAIQHGGVRVSGDARALHVRTEMAKWGSESLSLSALETALRPIIGDDGWRRLLPLIGEAK